MDLLPRTRDFRRRPIKIQHGIIYANQTIGTVNFLNPLGTDKPI